MSTPPTASRLPEPERSEPLTFRQDLVRALRNRPAPLDADGKPVIQPWAVGPGRIVGFVAAVAGVVASLFFAPLGIALGLLGLVLSNTAWAHLRNARRPRKLPLAGQIVSGVAVLLGAVSLVVLGMPGG